MAALVVGKSAAASARLDQFSLRRARALTLIILIVVIAGIALANLSSQPATLDFVKSAIDTGIPVERSFGWPLTWYWRRKAVMGIAFRWPIWRWVAWRLVANLGVWLLMLASAATTCEWLLRRYRPRVRWRLGITTLLMLAPLSAAIMPANLPADDPAMQPGTDVYYGWPLLWYWHFYFPLLFGSAGSIEDWDYSAAALAGNLALWLLMLSVTAITWEWLMRRCRPRFRWNFKTMLGAVAAAAVLFAWCANARNRAELQDPLLDMAGGDWCVKRWGPKWLDIVGADRFRRRIVGAVVMADDSDLGGPDVEEQLTRLSRLRDLRFLAFVPLSSRITPGMGAALRQMPRLCMLDIECDSGRVAPDDWRGFLAAVGTVTHLERLRATVWHENERDLAYLAGLSDLKSLTLRVIPYSMSDDTNQAVAQSGESRTLAYLPPLRRLESLELRDRDLVDRDLGRLADFPRLKSLDLSATSVTGAGLAKLALLESLEEVAINEAIATEPAFESLARFVHLRAIHIDGAAYGPEGAEKPRPAERAGYEFGGDDIESTRRRKVPLDDGSELVVLPGQLDGICRRLAALRESHPGIVIDAAYEAFRQRRGFSAPGLLDDQLSTFVNDRFDQP